MTPEQQQVWGIVSGNYALVSHVWGKELAELAEKQSKNKFHSRANEYLTAILDWPIEERCRAVKTWLSVYSIPLEPDRLDSFTQFHEITGPFILNQIKKILVYDQASN